MNRLIGVSLVAVAALTLTACGDTAPARPEAAKTSNGDGSFQGNRADKVRAGVAVLDKTSLLPKDWRPVPVSSRLSKPPGRPSYCGVFAEPDPIRQSALTLYEESPSERRILQYTFVSTESGAKAMMGRLVPAAADCSEPGFTVKPVAGFTVTGDETVALDYGNDSGAASRAVVFRVKDTIVVLVGYGPASVPATPLQAVAATIGGLLAG